MSIATLNLRVTPRRMLSLKEAAEYCGVSARRFPTTCPMPPIAMPDGSTNYDMKDLDRWIESLKSEQPNSDSQLIARLA